MFLDVSVERLWFYDHLNRSQDLLAGQLRWLLQEVEVCAGKNWTIVAGISHPHSCLGSTRSCLGFQCLAQGHFSMNYAAV